VSEKSAMSFLRPITAFARSIPSRRVDINIRDLRDPAPFPDPNHPRVSLWRPRLA
jgi:hypothetical protein